MILRYYENSSGKNPIKQYIDSLPEEEQMDAYSVLGEMIKGKFNKIYPKQWKKKVYEVYFKKHNRIFYVILNDTIYILHACRKQKNKTEKQDANIVKKRAKELGKELNKTFI
nr:MAG TPA: protein of unknown function DUF891 [Bacteriophage sp.]